MHPLRNVRARASAPLVERSDKAARRSLRGELPRKELASGRGTIAARLESPSGAGSARKCGNETATRGTWLEAANAFARAI
jgi:hypothetical protein